MEREITGIVNHIMNSQRQMAKILQSERHIVEHIAKIVNEIPNRQPSFNTTEAIIKNSSDVTRTITSYLVNLAELEEAIAINLTIVMKELQVKDEGE
jgi:hypothetical protein